MSDRKSARDELVRRLIEEGLPQEDAEVTAAELLGTPVVEGAVFKPIYPDSFPALIRRAFYEQGLELATFTVRRAGETGLELRVLKTEP